MITVSYDVRSNTSHRYVVYLISDTDSISLDTSCDPCSEHENIWESTLIAAPSDDVEFEDAFLSVELIGEDNTYQNIQIDNVCIEIESTMVNTNDLIDASNIHIYPNPTSDVLNIKFDNSVFEILEVYDINGRLLIEETLDINAITHSLQTEELFSGVYFIRFLDRQGSIAYKEFVKTD